MEIRDIFELRKQGRTEEAYAAILPMYAAHKGHYTTIAMFWGGVDMMKLRYQQRRLEEAYKIFKSLMKLYPTMDDRDLKGQSAMMRAALLVFDHHPGFSMLDFITQWDITRLTEDDWTRGLSNGHPVPSIGIRIVGKVFKEVESRPTVDMALKAAPILAEALKHSPYNMNNQRYKAMVYRIMGKKDKAINIYMHLISNALHPRRTAVRKRQTPCPLRAGQVYRRPQTAGIFHHMGDAEPGGKSGRSQPRNGC